MAGKQGRRAKRRKPKQSYEELQSAISKKENTKQFMSRFNQELYEELEADFNLLIKSTVADLTSDAQRGGYSPVLTGFFASNWKAGIKPVEKIETTKDTEWESIKTTTKKIGGRRKTVLAMGQSPLIKQRHVVPNFQLKQKVYIGNSAKYATYALMSRKSKLISYAQGGGGGTTNLNKRIEEIMTDRKANIRIGAGVVGGMFFSRLRTSYEPGYAPRTGYIPTRGSS
tara:strand:- start:211 stop:891 length:681 start_codon:yes stop_codon:yes gene_type:complete